MTSRRRLPCEWELRTGCFDSCFCAWTPAWYNTPWSAKCQMTNRAKRLHISRTCAGTCHVWLELQNPTGTNEVTARIQDFHGKAWKNIRKISLFKVSLLNSIVLCVTLLCGAWLCKPGVMWLPAQGEALLGFLWENYCSVLVCTKFHNKEQRKAHSLATTVTSVWRFLNIGSSCLLLPANIMLCHRNPDGYSGSLLFGREVCLWVGVFTDVIKRSYINSARHNGMGSACAVNKCDFHNTVPMEMIPFHISKLSPS